VLTLISKCCKKNIFGVILAFSATLKPNAQKTLFSNSGFGPARSYLFHPTGQLPRDFLQAHHRLCVSWMLQLLGKEQHLKLDSKVELQQPGQEEHARKKKTKPKKR
jgi:hypothetical protein